MRFFRFSCSLFLLAASGSAALRAGAAKVDITPAANAALPMSGYANRTEGFKGIHDPIYVRAIVVDDGTTQAAILAWELIFVPDPVWAELCAAHCQGNGDSGGERDRGGGPRPWRADAKGRVREEGRGRGDRSNPAGEVRLQPAKVGYGTGTTNVSVNRRESGPDGVVLGYNGEGASDKTVRLLRFDDLAGKPIAFLDQLCGARGGDGAG